MNDLATITREIISKSFPELINVEIDASYFKSKDALFEMTRNSRYSYNLDVHKSLKRIKAPILIGGIAHELVHISKEVRMSDFVSNLDIIAINTLPFYSAFDERQTDKETIKRGYGNELLEFTKYHDKHRENYNLFDGLTVKEIRKLVGK